MIDQKKRIYKALQSNYQGKKKEDLNVLNLLLKPIIKAGLTLQRVFTYISQEPIDKITTSLSLCFLAEQCSKLYNNSNTSTAMKTRFPEAKEMEMKIKKAAERAAPILSQMAKTLKILYALLENIRGQLFLKGGLKNFCNLPSTGKKRNFFKRCC